MERHLSKKLGQTYQGALEPPFSRVINRADTPVLWAYLSNGLKTPWYFWSEAAAPWFFRSCGPRTLIPAAQAPQPRKQSWSSLGSCSSPGKVEAGRAQGSEYAPAPGRPELYRSVPPSPPWEHPGLCRLGAAVVTVVADSRPVELAPPV